MSSGWLVRATLLSTAQIVASCQQPAVGPPAPTSSAIPAATPTASPAMSTPPPTPPPASPSPVSFDEDLAFLSKYGPVKVLSSASGGRIAVSGQYQARVMTSAVGAGGRSLGFINRKFIEAGQTATPFDNYGGEDRFWLGPEGGQYGLYFPVGKPFSFDNWQTPHTLQEGAWQAHTESPTSISYTHAFTVSNYAKREFKVEVERNILLLSAEEASSRLGLALPATLSWVGYTTSNKLTNKGSDAWT